MLPLSPHGRVFPFNPAYVEVIQLSKTKELKLPRNRDPDVRNVRLVIADS